MPDISVTEPEKIDGQRVPYGKRTIGTENPEKMTSEEFMNSKELLFHGSGIPFSYDLNFKYDSDFYKTFDGSLTLGTGFYSTPNKDQAENYSQERQVGTEGKSLNVIAVLPKKAEMLDLRGKNTLQENAPIPKELFEKWREKFVRYYKDQDKNSIPWYEDKFQKSYLEHLDKLAEFPDIDLRSMLWTGGDERTHDGWYPSPTWVDLFAQFMRDEGYDGVIYIEGGEGQKGESSPTYCFFNTGVVDTYEGWQMRKSEATK